VLLDIALFGYSRGMSDSTENIERDQKSGRFLPGNSGFGGRPRGSRNKLGEAFLEDLRDSWIEQGPRALARCAEEDPAGYCRIVASLMPKDIDVNVTGSVDVGDFAERFRGALAMLGNQPKVKTIEHVPGKRR
jgi:hypothetical protein